MPELPNGFALKMLFASLVMSAFGIAGAKAVMQVVQPSAPPVAEVPQAAPTPPVAEAIIPPTVVSKPAEKPVVAAAVHRTPAHHGAKFSALVRHLTTRHTSEKARHVAAAKAPVPALPPGMQAPPGYYGPAPDPYQRMVYAGPPPGVYGGAWGYGGRYPYFP